jgi:predicted nucleotide-binding protein (sugar kinase/HSP70/actin superfamily)
MATITNGDPFSGGQPLVLFYLGECMRIGIPEALLFRRYEPFIRRFFDNLKVDVVYSGPTNGEIMERGIAHCVDEACLPMKIFQGHVVKLQEECDKVVVPRLMKCEFGDSICPKFAGLPELVGKGRTASKIIFTEPLYLNDRNKLRKAIIKQRKQIGASKAKVDEAFRGVEELVRAKKQGECYGAGAVRSCEGGVKNTCGITSIHDGAIKAALLGHPYNISDCYANMNLVSKLKRLGICPVTGDELTRQDLDEQMTGLMKAPYWRFYRENFGKAMALLKKGSVDGILYVSSFCCGTDSVTIEMIRSRIGDFPMLVLKLDEHTAEAGMDTRLEAFAELLDRRRQKIKRDSPF